MKRILDACCGSRMFWFNQHNPDVLYMDKRKETIVLNDERKVIVEPDVIGDFTKMPFESERFNLVVFDPPHLIHAGNKSWLSAKYGVLERNWEKTILDGFSECMRVLKKMVF